MRKVLLTMRKVLGLAAALMLAACSQPQTGALKASGTVEAVEVAVAPEMGGRVALVAVREGDPVKTGQVLLQFDDALPRAQLRQAEAGLAAAQAARDLLAAGATAEQTRQAEAAVVSARAAFSRTVESARPADITAAKAAVAAAVENYNKLKRGPTREDIAAAEAAVRSADAARKSAQMAYDAAFRLNPAGIGASPAAVALEQATNAYDAAKSQYDKAAKGADAAQLAAANQQVQNANAALDKAQQPARAFDVEQAQAGLDQARARLDELKAGARKEQLAAADAQVAAAQGALDVLKTQIGKLTLIAPLDAVVLRRSVEPGEIALPGAPVLQLAKLDDLSVTVYVPEDRYGQIQAGHTARVTSDSFPGEAFIGRVDRVADRAEFTPRNVQTAEGRRTTVFGVRLKVDDPDHRLRPGMPVDVEFGP